MKPLIIFILVLQSLSGWSQSISNDTTKNSDRFKSIEEILQGSIKINKVTFNLKFLLRALPDNGWFLQLNRDSTFEYIHWSGWGESEGTVLEKGKYNITNNLIKLESNKSNSELTSGTYFIVTSHTNRIDNNITIDCVESDSKIYCLYHK